MFVQQYGKGCAHVVDKGVLRLAGTWCSPWQLTSIAWRIGVMMLPFKDMCMPALELKAGEVEAIRMGLFWLLTKLCSPLCFCQEDANVVMSLAFHNLPVGLGFVVLALFSAGSVSAVVFVAAFGPPKLRGASGRWNAPTFVGWRLPMLHCDFPLICAIQRRHPE